MIIYKALLIQHLSKHCLQCALQLNGRTSRTQTNANRGLHCVTRQAHLHYHMLLQHDITVLFYNWKNIIHKKVIT